MNSTLESMENKDFYSRKMHLSEITENNNDLTEYTEQTEDER